MVQKISTCNYILIVSSSILINQTEIFIHVVRDLICCILHDGYRMLAYRHYQVSKTSLKALAVTEDLGSRVGFLLGNSGVIAINAVLAHDLGDAEACQAIICSSCKYFFY